MIGTTRRINPLTNTIEWCRTPSQGQKTPPADAKESVIYRIAPELEGKKLIFQIGTSDPDRAVEAARIVAGDVVGIDVNAGCPKPFSTHAGMGAALLRTPDTLVAILRALVENIVPEFGIGISVKIRLLATAAETEVLVRRLVATGITGLTIHCRTTPMRPREAALRDQLRMIADICHEAGVACLVNGDVANRDHAYKLMEEFGVDGAMIATAAEKNSSCFRSAEQGGMAPWQEVVENYIKMAMDVGNKYGNTKYLLAQYIPGKSPVYRHLSACKSFTATCEMLGLTHLMEQAVEADKRLGLIPGAKSQAQHAKRNSSALTGEQVAEAVSSKRPRTEISEQDVETVPELPQAAVALSA